MKVCSKCSINKDFLEFYKDKSKKDGFGHSCKACDSLRRKLHYSQNKEISKQSRKEYYKNNKEKINLRNKFYYETHKIQLLEWQKEYLKNPIHAEKAKQAKRKYYDKNVDKAKNRTKKWRKDNYEHYINNHKLHYENNREEFLKQCQAYKKANPGLVNAWNAKRRAAKLEATPKWLTRTQLEEIEEIYVECARLTKTTGIPHEVDHIVPLQGKSARGLHVPWNLQILTQSENAKKHNKL